MANPQASLGFVQSWTSKMVSDPSFADVTAFINNPNVSSVVMTDASFNDATYNTAAAQALKALQAPQVASYNLMKNALDGMFDRHKPTVGGRTLLMIDDGTVIYDNSKTTNTAQAYKAKTINENHSGRPECLLATLSNSGVGWSNRHSSSVASSLIYYAYRLGQNTNSSDGVLRVSIQTSL
jgi:hypothetical protein